MTSSRKFGNIIADTNKHAANFFFITSTSTSHVVYPIHHTNTSRNLDGLAGESSDREGENDIPS